MNTAPLTVVTAFLGLSSSSCFMHSLVALGSESFAQHVLLDLASLSKNLVSFRIDVFGRFMSAGCQPF